MEEDRIRWDRRYSGAELPVPQAPEALADHPALVDALPHSGRALDIAAGTGATSIWLARRGLDVCALEISPAAIDLLGRGARAAGVTSRVEPRLVDLDDGLPADLRRLDVVVCQRFRDVRLYPAIVDALAPGGTGIVTVLSVVDREGPPGAFHAAAGELMAAFDRRDTEVIHHAEAAGLASVVFRRTTT